MSTEQYIDEERSASWLELFFDLVVVAAVAQLAHRMHAHGVHLADLWQFLLLYFALWQSWAAYTMYTNIAADKVHRRPLLLGMAGIAVMAAAIPQAFGERAEVFALAYVATRLISSFTWGRLNQVTTAWPIAQMGGGIVPWLISLWVPTPAKYFLWAFGVLIDVLITVMVSPDDMERFMTRAEQRMEHSRRPRPMPEFAKVTPSHLRERMGLFVIIVLGEGVLQVIDAGTGTHWDVELGGVAVACFALLSCLWWFTFEHGFGRRIRLQLNVMLLAHFLCVASVTAIAVGLGASVAHPAYSLDSGTRWLFCASVSIFATMMSVLNMTGTRQWLIGGALVVSPLIVGVAGGPLRASSVAAILAAITLLQAVFLAWARKTASASPTVRRAD